MKDLLDEDGENRAVRSFLLWYGGVDIHRIGSARTHMRLSGWDKLWPPFIGEAHEDTHLTKAGAQIWIRYLFDLEKIREPEGRVETVVTTRPPHPNAFMQVPVGTEIKVYWPDLNKNK